MTLRSGAVLAVVVSLAMAGCTGSGEIANGDPSTPSVPAVTSADFEEAFRTLPMNGTQDLSITWGTSEVPETAEVLSARRTLVFRYWQQSLPNGMSVTPTAQFVLTDRLYQRIYAPTIGGPDDGERTSGQIWVKTMGVESTGPDEALVTFCTDIGYWRLPQDDEPGIRDNRALLESYVVTYAPAVDGERRWLTDGVRANDREAQGPKYGAECEKWAKHTP